MENWDEALLGKEEPKPQPIAEKPKETNDAASVLLEAKRQIAELGAKHASDPGGGYLEKIKELQEKTKKIEAHENAL